MEKSEKSTGGLNPEDILKYEEDYVKFAGKVRKVDFTYYGNWQRDFGKLMVELLGSPNTGNLLDVGCATGLNLRGIEETGVFNQLYGVDVSKFMLSMIPEMHKFKSAEFVNTVAWDLSAFQDESIDNIICTHVLEHLPDDNTVIKTMLEFKRVLQKGGKILIILPCIKKEGEKGWEDQKDEIITHLTMHEAKWWSATFAKFFKSETFTVRKLLKASKLKPDRNGPNTFYENYPSWNVFRLTTKR